jgi:pilus assembly protein TadC
VLVAVAGGAGRPMTDRWPAALLLALALLAWSPSRSRVGRRIGVLRTPLPADRGPIRAPVVHPLVRRRVWAGVVGLVGAVLLGGVLGVAVGAVVALGVDRLLVTDGRAEASATRAARERELPVACDLLAVALATGLPVGEALGAVGASLPAPLGPDLRRIAALYRLGAEPRRAWGEVPEELVGLGRVLVRAGESGSAVGPALTALAADRRASVRAATETAVRRAGVWVLAPLGLCFLPAFLCLGVVPLVLGIAGAVFG